MIVDKNDKKILCKEVIEKITGTEYDSGERVFTLSGFHIPVDLNTYSHCGQEKRLQWLAQRQLELLTGDRIIEEDLSTSEDDNGGYILDDVLLEKIKVINKNKINGYLSTKNASKSFDQVAQIIYKDFVKRFNQIRVLKEPNKNVKLHSLFFNDNRDLYVKIDGFKIDYFVIDTTDYRTNQIDIIKEKKLVCSGSSEHPDFAVYYNGLPFIVIEMKRISLNGISGTNKAIEDYKRKKSYHNFLACIGTNGVDAFISSQPNNLMFFKWMNYKNLNGYIGGYDEADENGFYDIISEIVVSPKNMLFYFESCTMISECGSYLKNARIQQYMTAKKIYEKMLSGSSGFKNHFQHHTRTGKSFTFKIIAKMAYQKFNKKYKKAIFFTHDVSSVMPTILKEFKNLEFPSGSMKEIKSKREYKRLLGSNSIFGLYIANMQIVEQSKEPIDDSDGVLIFIDEVHTNQKMSDGVLNKIKKTMADFRNLHFPDATIISATASPLYTEQKNSSGEVVFRNITAEMYGDCIDKFTPSDALRLGLVTKLNYEKYNYQASGLSKLIQDVSDHEEKQAQVLLDNLLGNIDVLIEQNLSNSLSFERVNLDVVERYNAIKVTGENYNKVVTLNPYREDHADFAIMLYLLNNLQAVINKDLDSIKRKLRPQFRKSVWLSTLREKIDSIVIPDVLTQRKSHPLFMPKSFYVVNPRENQNDKTNGELMLGLIREMIRDYISKNPDYDSRLFNVENNTYKGVRFGFDSSDGDKASYNGNLGGFSDVTSLFEADEIEDKEHLFVKPVDVLILVRKKLMGYDNKNLTTVFLDKEIDESNIKEMLQLSTRGTTKREGKKLGYIKDLTFSTRNINTFKKAFSVYDEKDGVKDFLFDEDEIAKLIELVEENRNELIELISGEKEFSDKGKDILLNDPVILKLIDYVRMQYWQWRSSKKSGEKYFIEKYIGLVSRIEKTYKKLVSPQFILEKHGRADLFEDVMSIFQINAALLKDIKDKARGRIYKRQYTTEDITGILEDSFQTFGGLSAFIDQMDLVYKGKSFVTISEKYITDRKKGGVVDTISRIQKDLDVINSSSLSGKFREELEEISIFVDSSSDTEIDSQSGKIERLKNRVQKEKERKKKRIQDEFNNNSGSYEIMVNFEGEFEPKYHECLLECAKEWDINIKKVINNIDLNKALSEKLLYILNNFNFNMPSSIEKDSSLFDDLKYVYNKALKPNDGFIKVDEGLLRRKLENGVSVDDIKDTNNRVLNIFLSYLNNG